MPSNYDNGDKGVQKDSTGEAKASATTGSSDSKPRRKQSSSPGNFRFPGIFEVGPQMTVGEALALKPGDPRWEQGERLVSPTAKELVDYCEAKMKGGGGNGEVKPVFGPERPPDLSKASVTSCKFVTAGPGMEESPKGETSDWRSEV